ncbi:MAG: WbqC family protein [Bacteroidaceae bacterium]|nr:WbqC family protein [Bacteroidaceae bacterium]
MPTVLLSSAYLPPVSFFTAMNGASEVLIEQYDSYCKQTYRNRCVIASASGPLVLTVPVVKPDSPKQTMKDVRISDHGDWRRRHWNALESAYMNTPFFMYYQDDFKPFYEKKWDFLIDFNMSLIQTILDLSHLEKNISLTGSFVRNSNLEEGIKDLRKLIEPQNTPEPAKSYWQVFSRKHGFLPNLSAIDLLFNMGPEFKSFI